MKVRHKLLSILFALALILTVTATVAEAAVTDTPAGVRNHLPSTAKDVIYLSDMTWEYSTNNGGKEATKDGTWSKGLAIVMGNTAANGGTAFTKGLGVQPYAGGATAETLSHTVFDLADNNYAQSYFYAAAGITNDAAKSGTTVTNGVYFEVWASFDKSVDNYSDAEFVLLEKSDKITTSLVYQFHLDITGARYLKLVVYGAQTSISYMDCNWAGACVYNNAGYYPKTDMIGNCTGDEGLYVAYEDRDPTKTPTMFNAMECMFNTYRYPNLPASAIKLSSLSHKSLYAPGLGKTGAVWVGGTHVATNGQGYLSQKDGVKFPAGASIYFKNKPVTDGVAEGYVVYDVSKLNVDRFYAIIGRTDHDQKYQDYNPADGTYGGVVFEVWGQKTGSSEYELLSASEVITKSHSGEFYVDISGVELLKLRVYQQDPRSAQSNVAFAYASLFSEWEMDITGAASVIKGTAAEYTAAIRHNFADDYAGDITWTVSGAQMPGTEMKDGRLTVDPNETANELKITVSVTDGGKTVTSAPITVEVRDKTYAAIKKQPVSVTVPGGETASVVIDAIGDGLTYTWYYKQAGSETFQLTRAVTGSTYAVTMNKDRNGRQLYCVVSDAYGSSVTTDVVTIAMENSLVINGTLSDIEVSAGEQATLTVDVTGTDALTYRWYYKNLGADDFQLTNSFTGNTYSVAMNKDRSGRQVYCVISDAYGNSVTTNTATISMKNPLVLTQDAVDVAVANGEKATVTVAATGDSKLTYQWYYKNLGDDVFRLTGTFKENYYSVVMNKDRNGRQIFCRITDKVGNSVDTATVTLSITNSIQITRNTQSVTVAEGETATVYFDAIGENLSYRWYYMDAVVGRFIPTGAFTGNVYSVTMNQVRNGRQLFCVVTDEGGNTATTATVTISMAADDSDNEVELLDSHQVLLSDIGTGRIVVADLDCADTFSLENLVWQWYPTTELGWDYITQQSLVGGLSELKSRWSEHFRTNVVLFCNARGSVGMIEYPSGKCLWKAKVGNSPHSIELLPDGDIVVASSGGGTWENGRLYYYDLGADGTYTATGEYKLNGAHGLSWDDDSNVLWALGFPELVAYSLGTGEDGRDILHLIPNIGCSVPDATGHDLMPNAADPDVLWFTDDESVLQYSKKQNKLLETFPNSAELKAVRNVKGVTSFSDGTVALVSYADVPSGGHPSTVRVFWPKEDGTFELEKYTDVASGWNKVRTFTTDKS